MEQLITLPSFTHISSLTIIPNYPLLSIDTTRLGLRFKNLTNEEVFKLHDCLLELESVPSLKIRRRNHGGVYRKGIKITLDKGKGKRNPYVYINFFPRAKYKYAYDVKFTFHFSWFQDEVELLKLLNDADASGVLVSNLLRSELNMLDLKFDFAIPLNFFLMHLDCDLGRKPYVDPRSGRRTLYINKNFYFYEKFLDGIHSVRMEVKLRSSKKVNEFLPGVSISDLFENNYSVAESLLSRCWLVQPLQVIRKRTKRISKVLLEIENLYKTIDSQGLSTLDSFIQRKIVLNKQFQGKLSDVAGKCLMKQSLWEFISSIKDGEEFSQNKNHLLLHTPI